MSKVRIRYIGNSEILTQYFPIGLGRNKGKRMDFYRGDVKEIDAADAEKLLRLNQQAMPESDLSAEDQSLMGAGHPAYQKTTIEKLVKVPRLDDLKQPMKDEDGKIIYDRMKREIPAVIRQANFIKADALEAWEKGLKPASVVSEKREEVQTASLVDAPKREEAPGPKPKKRGRPAKSGARA